MAVDRFVERPLHVEKGLGLGLETNKKARLNQRDEKSSARILQKARKLNSWGLEKFYVVRWNVSCIRFTKRRMSDLDRCRWSFGKKLYSWTLERVSRVCVLGLLFLKSKRDMPLIDTQNSPRTKTRRSSPRKNKCGIRTNFARRAGIGKCHGAFSTSFKTWQKTYLEIERKNRRVNSKESSRSWLVLVSNLWFMPEVNYFCPKMSGAPAES